MRLARTTKIVRLSRRAGRMPPTWTSPPAIALRDGLAMTLGKLAPAEPPSAASPRSTTDHPGQHRVNRLPGYGRS